MRKHDIAQIMDQETRVTLMDLARRHPGVTVKAAADALRVDYSTVQYHVRILRRHGVLSCMDVAGALRLYPPGAIPSRAERHVLRALRSPSARTVAHVTRTRGATTVADLVRDLGMSRTTAQEHLLRLERAGLLTATRAGNAKVYAPAPDVPDPAVPDERPVPAPPGLAS